MTAGRCFPFPSSDQQKCQIKEELLLALIERDIAKCRIQLLCSIRSICKYLNKDFNTENKHCSEIHRHSIKLNLKNLLWDRKKSVWFYQDTDAQEHIFKYRNSFKRKYATLKQSTCANNRTIPAPMRVEGFWARCLHRERKNERQLVFFRGGLCAFKKLKIILREVHSDSGCSWYISRIQDYIERSWIRKRPIDQYPAEALRQVKRKTPACLRVLSALLLRNQHALA